MSKMRTNILITIKLIVIGLCLVNSAVVSAQGTTFDIFHVPKETQGSGIKITFNGSKYEPAKEIKINVIKTVSAIKSELDFVEQILSIQRQGTSEKYSELWEKKLKSKVVSTYKAKPEEWAYLQNQMQAIQNAKMKGVIKETLQNPVISPC